jgi:hypothetical protein
MVELPPPLYRNQHTMSLDNTFAIEIIKLNRALRVEPSAWKAKLALAQLSCVHYARNRMSVL